MSVEKASRAREGRRARGQDKKDELRCFEESESSFSTTTKHHRSPRRLSSLCLPCRSSTLRLLLLLHSTSSCSSLPSSLERGDYFGRQAGRKNLETREAFLQEPLAEELDGEEKPKKMKERLSLSFTCVPSLKLEPLSDQDDGSLRVPSGPDQAGTSSRERRPGHRRAAAARSGPDARS